MALINTKQARPGMSMTEKIALVIDLPGRACYLISSDVKYRHPCRHRLRHQLLQVFLRESPYAFEVG